MDTPLKNARQQELTNVAEQASAWLVAVEEGDTKEFPALSEWLAESPLHVEMLLRMTAVDRLLDSVSEEQRQLIWKSIDAGPKNNVVPLADEPSMELRYAALQLSTDFPAVQTDKRTSASKLRSPSQWRWARLAAGLLLAVVAFWWFGVRDSVLSQRFTTGIGEQRSVSLVDGSVLYLNTHSHVDVHFSAAARELHLVSGEALFQVHGDSKRPFRVRVGNIVVQALGTQFDINRQPQQMTVSVIDGVVKIAQEKLTSGQTMTVAMDGAVKKRAAADTSQVTAWRQRRLVFRWAPLGAIAEEFNRYNRAPQIHVETDDLRERRYTAVFDADAPEELLNFLARDADLSVTQRGDDVLIQPR